MARTLYLLILPVFIIFFINLKNTGESHKKEKGLIAYWKLQGDCLDYSGNNNNGINHDVNLQTGAFNGKSSYIEVPHNKMFDFGSGDFSINVWIYTEKIVDDIIGDILSKYDPDKRCGITLSVNSSAGGYQSIGTDRHIHFGIDNAQGANNWQDCGRPAQGSNYVSNSLTVYKGKLYAAIGHALEEKDRAHVYRYEGGTKWTDLGRVGNYKTTGVFPMIVHNDNLYVVTSTYDWTRVKTGDYDPGRVYRFVDINNWVDCGLTSNNRTNNCIASFQGRLFTGGGPETYAIYTQKENKENEWIISKIFDKEGPERCFPHTMMVYNKKLYVGFPNIFSFDGFNWEFEGDPVMTDGTKGSPQTHSLVVYRGYLCAGTWPEGKVSIYLGDKKWENMGKVGIDGTEVNSLVVYNGKLYGGSLPRAEICRYDDKDEWTSLKRFYDPPGWVPVSPADRNASREERNEWSRVTSMTIYDGKLFAGTGSCTSSPLDAPLDGVLGKVFCMEAGKNVSYDYDIGPGWKQITAIKRKGHLELFINGKLVKKSSKFNKKDYQLNNNKALKIGFGEIDYFNGKINELKIFNRALSNSEIQRLFKKTANKINNM